MRDQFTAGRVFVIVALGEGDNTSSYVETLKEAHTGRPGGTDSLENPERLRQVLETASNVDPVEASHYPFDLGSEFASLDSR